MFKCEDVFCMFMTRSLWINDERSSLCISLFWCVSARVIGGTPALLPQGEPATFPVIMSLLWTRSRLRSKSHICVYVICMQSQQASCVQGGGAKRWCHLKHSHVTPTWPLRVTYVNHLPTLNESSDDISNIPNIFDQVVVRETDPQTLSISWA